ncbi:glycosyltransferase 61 family protein, partial [Microcoleus sp. T3B2]
AVAYRKLVEINPDFCWSYERLGKALIALENWGEATAAYRKAIELNPDDCWLYNCLGEVLESQENWSEAAVAFGRAIELESEQSWLYKKLGDALRNQGDLERAIAIYEKGINLDPKSCWFYKGLGLSLIAKQQWEPAITTLVQALQIKPDLLEAYDNIGYALEQQGEVDESDWEKCSHQILPLSVLKKYCQFTEDMIVAAESNPNISCIDIYPATQINLSASQTTDNNNNLLSPKKIYIKKAFVAILPNGRAWADVINTAAITSDNKLVLDVSMGCPELIVTSDKLPPVEHIDGSVAFLSAPWGGAYFHWMFDVITRFDHIQRSGLIDSVDKFVVNAGDYTYQKETLNTLGIPQYKILESGCSFHITADNLIVPSICKDGSGTSKWKCEYLKQSFLNHKIPLKTDCSERIYITRQQASYRRIVNEEEVVNYLQKFGFRSVKLETMSVAEQAACLAAAKVVVAPHGAGLTNLVFCTPGTKVIEIFSPMYVPSCYWTISNLCGLEHYSLIGDLVNDRTPIKPLHKDMRLDVKSLEKLMNLAGVLHG